MTGGEKAPTVKDVAHQQKLDGERLSVLEKDVSNMKLKITSIEETLSSQFTTICRHLHIPIPPDPGASAETNDVHQQTESEFSSSMILPSFNFFRQPKIDFPRFDGFNPRAWLRKCERFFYLNVVDPSKRVDLASIHMDDKADAWFLDYQEDVAYDNYVGSFNKLSQTTTVEEYFERYESFKAIMKNKNQSFSEDYFTMSFISGLKEEICNPVQMFKTNSDSEAFYLARLQQASVDSQLKRSKPFHRPFTPSTNSFSPSSRYKPSLAPLTNLSKTYFSSDKPIITHPLTPTKPEPSLPPIKRLTPAQMQARRDKGLCYNCDVFYKPGHHCKTQQLFTLVASDEDNSSPPIDDSEEEAASPTTSEDTTMEISLHSLTGLVNQSIIRVPSKLNKHDIFILIDTGSTHSFIDEKLANKLQLHLVPTGKMLVTVTTVSEGVCQDLQWSMQGYHFSADLRILPLGGCDMVLGVDWLKKLGDVMFNMAELKVSFHHHGKLITLQGHSPTPSCSLLSGESFFKFIKNNTPSLIGQFFSISATPLTPTPPEITSLLQEYADVFAEPSTLPPPRELYHKIPLKPSSLPISQRPYRCPYIKKAVVEQLVQEMMDVGLIQDNHNPFDAPILLVKKKDGSWRFCVDYRKLNDMTIKDKFPIPLIEELLDELNGDIVFTKLYLRYGYHQIRMHIQDIYKTAFRTMGILSSSKSLEDHLVYLSEVLSLLRQHCLSANFKKCCFAQPQLAYLGHLISTEGVAADPDKLGAMQDWPQPTNLKKLRGFLGLAGYYRRFIKGYGTISRPLTDMIKKNSFFWSPTALQAFTTLKQAMITSPLLALPDFYSPFVLETDACSKGVGAVLMQFGRPIAFFSKPLGPKALALSTYEKELLAIVMAVQK
ncbi:uncharacterized protein LOC113316109 [Papaver somniferum]|uniref:uncharacterized protein LOC113316109 n=1 Tax=Papaver somniferum TaxID=3469 RepID=UPI000E6FDF81|nr:uncharacterized protein LOC113316109 [Papaver somniferum]